MSRCSKWNYKTFQHFLRMFQIMEWKNGGKKKKVKGLAFLGVRQQRQNHRIVEVRKRSLTPMQFICFLLFFNLIKLPEMFSFLYCHPIRCSRGKKEVRTDFRPCLFCIYFRRKYRAVLVIKEIQPQGGLEIKSSSILIIIQATKCGLGEI